MLDDGWGKLVLGPDIFQADESGFCMVDESPPIPCNIALPMSLVGKLFSRWPNNGPLLEA